MITKRLNPVTKQRIYHEEIQTEKKRDANSPQTHKKNTNRHKSATVCHKETQIQQKGMQNVQKRTTIDHKRLTVVCEVVHVLSLHVLVQQNSPPLSIDN